MKKAIVPSPMAREDGKVETDPREERGLNVWRRFSEGIATGTPEELARYDEPQRQRVEQKLEYLKRFRQRQEGMDDPITEQEVLRALRKMKSGKAPGVDGVLSTILRTAAGAVGTNRVGTGGWECPCAYAVVQLCVHERGVACLLAKCDSSLRCIETVAG
jgi:hypothetical protein